MDRPSVMPFIMDCWRLPLASLCLFDVLQQSSSARRIFRFMGWAGSLVVLIDVWSSGTRAYQLLPMLPFILPLFAIWFSRDGEENDRIERRGRKKKTHKFGPLTLEPSFLTAK